jgi:hypothetical protein
MAAFGKQHGTPIPLSNAEAWVATQLATLLVFGLTWWVLSKPRLTRWYQWLLVMVAGISLNVFSHVAITLHYGAISPGTVSGVLLNLPLGVYLLWRCLKSGMITPRGLLLVILGGLLVQIPLIFALLELANLIV